MADPRPSPSRWLFGPLPDLLLGCGGAYAVIFLAQVAAGAELRARLPGSLLTLLILITSVPHYGATLFRVYERRENRAAGRMTGRVPPRRSSTETSNSRS